MDSMEKIVIKKSEAQLIVDALEFTANKVEFKNAYFITGDKIDFVAQKIKKQIKQNTKLLERRGIPEITIGWK